MGKRMGKKYLWASTIGGSWKLFFIYGMTTWLDPWNYDTMILENHWKDFFVVEPLDPFYGMIRTYWDDCGDLRSSTMGRPDPTTA